MLLAMCILPTELTFTVRIACSLPIWEARAVREAFLSAARLATNRFGGRTALLRYVWYERVGGTIGNIEEWQTSRPLVLDDPSNDSPNRRLLPLIW